MLLKIHIDISSQLDQTRSLITLTHCRPFSSFSKQTGYLQLLKQTLLLWVEVVTEADVPSLHVPKTGYGAAQIRAHALDVGCVIADPPSGMVRDFGSSVYFISKYRLKPVVS